MTDFQVTLEQQKCSKYQSFKASAEGDETQIHETVHTQPRNISLRKLEPTGLPVLLRVHFYKLDDHSYLKPQNEQTFPIRSTSGCPSFPLEPRPIYKTHYVLLSNSKPPFRHTPLSRKTCPKKGNKRLRLVSPKNG